MNFETIDMGGYNLHLIKTKKFKTITFDNGGEFRNWKSLEKSYDKRRKKPRFLDFLRGDLL